MLLVTAQTGFSQNSYYTEFENYAEVGDTIKQYEILRDWEKDAPQDPELFYSYFLYYYLKANGKFEAGGVDKLYENNAERTSDTISFSYLSERFFAKHTEIDKAYAALDKAIALAPNRLDLRVYKIETTASLFFYKMALEALEDMIKQGAVNHMEWHLPANEEVVSENLVFEVFDKMFSNADFMSTHNIPYLKQTAQTAIQLFPNYAKGYTVLGMSYLVYDQKEEAIKILEQGAKVLPENISILKLLGQSYNLTDQTDKAKKVYEKIETVGTEAEKEYARSYLSTMD
ncbi:hypothetical protein Y10_01930 [Neptunitalea sp. Y10]|uniref:Tetratricopeptide repeat protein n=2 Tax=Neptunitalea lumnitzerae TaxID=2965509 RepID=A0ABQ5MFL6_9FLAO|nr:hypothetical protein Y10_01930 [Neptunitalea sp. Y10]